MRAASLTDSLLLRHAAHGPVATEVEVQTLGEFLWCPGFVFQQSDDLLDHPILRRHGHRRLSFRARRKLARIQVELEQPWDVLTIRRVRARWTRQPLLTERSAGDDVAEDLAAGQANARSHDETAWLFPPRPKVRQDARGPSLPYLVQHRFEFELSA